MPAFKRKVSYTLITTVLLLGLAICWIAILVPPMIRSGAPKRSRNNVDLQTALGSLQSAQSKQASVIALRGSVAAPAAPAPSAQLGAKQASAVKAMAANATAEISTAEAARRRRRDVVAGLGIAAFLTLILALVAGPIFAVLHLLVDIALVGYVVLIAQRKRIETEKANKVHQLQPIRRSRAAQMQQPVRRTGT